MSRGERLGGARREKGAVVKFRVYDLKNVTQIACLLLLMCF